MRELLFQIGTFKFSARPLNEWVVVAWKEEVLPSCESHFWGHLRRLQASKFRYHLSSRQTVCHLYQLFVFRLEITPRKVYHLIIKLSLPETRTSHGPSRRLLRSSRWNVFQHYGRFWDLVVLWHLGWAPNMSFAEAKGTRFSSGKFVHEQTLCFREADSQFPTSTNSNHRVWTWCIYQL